MKALLVSLIAIISIVTLYSCHEVDVDGKSTVIQDSLATVFPTWQAVKIKVGDNNTTMLVVIGDATFYKAPDDIKRQKASELGKMILRIYGKHNYFEKGNLLVTADIHNTSEAPADAINIPIDFEALKKEAGN